MKRIMVLAVAAALGVLSAFAEVKWTYEGTTLTEIVSSGTPWQFKLTSAGALSKIAFGDSKHIDLSDAALPDNAPDIVTIGASTFQNCSAESVIYPTTLTTFGDNVWYQCSAITNVCFSEPATITSLDRSNAARLFPASIRWMNVPASVTSFTSAMFGALPAKQTTATVVFDGDMPSSGVTSLFSTSSGANYDYYLRIKIDLAGHTAWQTYLNSANVTKWANLTAEQQAQFYAKFPGEPHPYALVTTAGSGMRANSWISENYQDDEYPYDDGYLATMDDTVTTNWVNGNLVYTFTNTGTLPIGRLRTDMTLKQYLVVGGGGAGGCQLGGGGGGGAALYLERDYPLVIGSAFDISVGKGGVGGFGTKGAQIKGGVGGATTFAFGSEKIVAYGGGGGAFCAQGKDTSSLPTEGATLASGGGAAMQSTVKAVSGTDYTDGRGFAGGSAAYCSGGGGGGFAGAGETGVAGEYDRSTSTYTGGTAGAGGHGLETTIRGVSEVFGAGGGAGGGSFYTGGGSRIYCKEITAGTADATAGAGGQGATGASAVAAFGGGGGGGGASLSGTTNTGFAGGNGGSGCVILVFSKGIASAQPEVDDVAVTFPDGYTQPQVAVTLGGEGSYAATVIVSCGTGALAQAGAAYECVRTFTGVANGDVVSFLADFYPNPGEQVYVKVSVSAVGAKDVTESAAQPATGTLPPFVGHGGDPAKVIHVRDGATGKATGRNWADAYPDFRAALKELGETRNELWYCGSNTLTTASAETVAPAFAATVRGGFAGVEDAAAERAAGAMSTIDGEGLHKTFVLANAASFTIDGIRFVNSSVNGVVKTGAGDLVVSNCAFEANGLVSSRILGRAVSATGDGTASQLTIANCRIARHYSQDANDMAPTLYVRSFAHATVADCLVVSNGCQIGITQSNGHGAALRVVDTVLDLRNTRFVANRGMIGHNGGKGALSDSGAIVSIEGASGGSTVANCLWAANEVIDGSANNTDPDKTAGSLCVALADPAATVTVRNCTFAGNFYCRDAATSGLSVKAGTVDVADSIFYGNLASCRTSKFPSDSAVRDIRVCSNATVRVRYTLFDDDTGCFAEDEATLELANCLTGDPRFVTTADVQSCLTKDGLSFDAAKWGEFAKFNAHVRSSRGYTDETTGELVKFAGEASPAVDAGDPASSFANEAQPNGRRVNLGFYGNTPWAVLSGGGTMLFVR